MAHLPTRRTAATLTVLALSVTLLAGPAHAGPPHPVRHHGDPVTVTDFRNDVIKNGAPYRKRKGPLDIHRARASATADTITVTVEVADLRRAHTRDLGENGWHYLATTLAVVLKWKHHREFLMFDPMDDPSGDDVLDRDCAETDPSSTYDINGVDQAADYEKDTYSFTIPIACLPDGVDAVAVSAYTGWGGTGLSIPPFSDDITTTRYGLDEKYTEPLTVR